MEAMLKHYHDVDCEHAAVEMPGNLVKIVFDPENTLVKPVKPDCIVGMLWSSF